LISGILANGYTLDLTEIMETTRPTGGFKLLLSYLPNRLHWYQTLILPKEIFMIEGVIVTFNLENSEFIKSFFGEML
jgi:hypothetical protein